MTSIVTTNSELNRIAAPNLPRAPEEYSTLHQNQLNNVLRLYFNRLDNLVGQITAEGNFIPALFVYTVATLPSAATSGTGARAFVSDALVATFASTVVGGGANKVPVYSDGTNWKIG